MSTSRGDSSGTESPQTDTRSRDGFLDRLRTLGLLPGSDEVVVERRGDRTMALLPDGRIAWFAMTPLAAEQLRTEDRVLGLVGARCGFPVPTVLTASGEGWALRSTVPGRVDPEGLAVRLRSDPALVARTGEALAGLLAEQHTRIVEADVTGWLPTAPYWPMPRAWIEERLPSVLGDAELRTRIDRLFDAYDRLGTQPHDRALIHSDLGLHNVAFDPDTGAVNGVFDYGSAAWADRHLDFRYLVFGAVPDALLDATMAAYERATGVAVNRRRVLLCNAAAAISYLADRAGHAPEEVVAGRTLNGDLRWTRWALERVSL